MPSLAGSAACAPCHRHEHATQIATSMARAMEPVAGCTILQQHQSLTFREGVYYFRIQRQGSNSLYSVTDGKDTISVPLQYAFGLGKAGQTYVFEREGKTYESRVSFYQALDGLDLTMGASSIKPRNLEEASGRLMSKTAAAQCFSCHATSASHEAFETPASLTPGVACEHCHGSASAHVEGFRQGKPVAMRRMSSLTTEELSDFCGQCHRTWAQIASEGPHNINNVRFQPYRLANSRCYDPSDNRIRCTACHDVHQEVVESSSFYDAKCLACHATARHAASRKCPVSNQNCVSCHMPKLDLPGAHYKFTDHQIRVVRQDAPYPP